MRARVRVAVAAVVALVGCGGKASHDDATTATGGEDTTAAAGAAGTAGAPQGTGGGGVGGAIAASGAAGAPQGTGGAVGAGGTSSGATSSGGDGSGGCAGVLTDVTYSFGDGGDFVAEKPTCPIDPALPECATADEVAVVARTAACFEASLAAHDCAPWEYDLANMLVLLPGDLCVGPTELVSVKRWEPCDAPAEIHIEYVQREWCEPCDTATPSWRMLLIPSDPAPVLAERRPADAAPCVAR